MTRNINLIVVHCSDSDNVNHDDIKIIDQWHKQRGFKKVGYHYFIKKNGDIQTGRNLDEIGAHVEGFNKNSVGICLSGKTNFTENQFSALRTLVNKLVTKYKLDFKDIVGHRELNKNKTCPNFNVAEILFNGEKKDEKSNQ